MNTFRHGTTGGAALLTMSLQHGSRLVHTDNGVAVGLP